MRQRGGNIHDLFAAAQQLLGEQLAQPVDVLDGPDPLRPQLRPHEQPVDLTPVGRHLDLGVDLFGSVEHHCGMGPLVGIDTDDGCRH